MLTHFSSNGTRYGPYISFDLKTTFNEEERERQVLEKLNSLGREGWELCAADKDHFYLKKEI